MLEFIISQFLFYISIILVLFIPGYFLMLAVFGKKSFPLLEKVILTFGSSIIVVDFLMIFIGKFTIPINKISILAAIFMFSAICFAIYYFRKPTIENKEIEIEKAYSKKQLVTIILILFLTIFIKTIYLKDAILPTSTDLGHHMYWAKDVATTGKLPVYEKVDIDENYNLSQPQPIADFIIGEHLIFAAIGVISGIDFISYFPVLVLYLIHMMGILMIFVLSRHLFKDSPHVENISIITLFLMGPVFALSSPQTKFVSGGVIGNTIGNFFIPLIIYLMVKALSEKSSKLFAYAAFVVLGLAYTHHLSTFVFIFIFLFSAIIFAILNFKNLKEHFKDWKNILLSKSFLSILAFGIILVFVFYTPTYLNKTAVDTAVGSPVKATRTGLTFTQLKFAAGEARMALGVIGLVLLLLAKRSFTYSKVFLLGWFFSIAVMSLQPNWLFIDIPSNRIADYIPFPLAILASFAFVSFLFAIKNSGKQFLRSQIIYSLLILLLTFISVNGFVDNSQSLNLDGQPSSILETYGASQYLAKNSNDSDVILKDHNYLSADSWIKLYFMRGYNYPLSRGYFKRYSDETKIREQCTNLMISSPNNSDAQKCFKGTGTNFLMINPTLDKAQFQKSNNFWQVYSAEDIAIFYKAQ